MATQDSNVNLLVEAVLAQANAEAKKIKESAQAAALQIVAQAEQQADRQRQTIRLADTERANRESAATLGAAHVQARQKVLEAREELIDRVFAQVEERLAESRNGPAYPRILVDLVREGVAALEGESFIVEVMPEDYNLASQTLNSAPLEDNRIEVRQNNLIRAGGCIISQADGRALYDNSFNSIVARHRLRSRALVAEILWGKETRWDQI